MDASSVRRKGDEQREQLISSIQIQSTIQSPSLIGKEHVSVALLPLELPLYLTLALVASICENFHLHLLEPREMCEFISPAYRNEPWLAFRSQRRVLLVEAR